MTNITAHEIAGIEIVEDAADFFAPADTDMVDGLIGQYRRTRTEIAEIAAFVAARLDGGAIDYFLEGNRDENAGRHALATSARKLFDEAGAVRALNSAYWSKALALTDVLDAMPQARRTEWHEQISSHKCPDFEEQTVRDTLATLLAMRTQFLAERVDGLFRALSGEHVTNAPEGFGRRMILAYMLNEWGGVNQQRVGIVNDLRTVIARFMGRGEPKHGATMPVIEAARMSYGKWVSVDGGALRLRIYMKGTVHLEVHPDMAWRLNCVLAQLHPLAIPAQFRQKPKKRLREFGLLKRPLPFRVVEVLAGMKQATEAIPADLVAWRGPKWEPIPMSRAFSHVMSTEVRADAEQVLAAIGGVKQAGGHWLFDYDPAPVLSEIFVSGCIPDQRAHQFYPTPRALAERLVELADIGADHTVLEPSAGMGGLADLLPKRLTLCIEVAELHATVLEAKGFSTVRADFLAWGTQQRHEFDRIVMNPPFSDGRWQAHVQHAAGMLSPRGRLAAILPSSARERLPEMLPDLCVEFHGQFDNAFAGASASVVMMTATKEEA